MQDNTVLKEKIIKAALKCSEDKSWADLTFSDIAKEAGVSLADLHQAFKTKKEILQAFSQYIDTEVLKRLQAEGNAATTEESARDRLFNVLMTRFELMQPYKKALSLIHKDLRYGKLLSDISIGQFLGSQNWMLTAADIQTAGVKGSVRLAGLSTVYLRALSVWFKDEDPGLAKTMAALDKSLSNGEGAVKKFDSFWDESCAFVGRLCDVVKPAKKQTHDSDPGQNSNQTKTETEPQTIIAVSSQDNGPKGGEAPPVV